VEAGTGLKRELARAWKALVAALAEDVVGTGQLWENKIKAVCCPFSAGLGDVHFIALVVFWGASNVPAINALDCPGAPLLRILVDKNSCAGRRKRSLIEVKGAAELCFGGEAQIDAPETDKI